MQFNDGLLKSFMSKFYGYGNLKGPLWFVGMEESGGDFAEIERRLATWDRRGRKSVEDLAEFHLGLEIDRNFRNERPVIQRTWRGLMIISLTVQRRETDKEIVREYQRTVWGRSSGSVALLELLPLPSPSIHQWIYGKHSLIPYLRTRNEYSEKMLPQRTQLLRELIVQYKPKAVVFYGRKYQPHWQGIVGSSFEMLSELPAQGTKVGDTVFLSISHPVARGLKDRFFIGAGRYLANNAIEPPLSQARPRDDIP